MPVGADVARHLPDLLVRDVEPVVAAEAEEEVVARDPGDGLRLEAEQLADPVVLVDDVVAGAQVGEALQRAPDAGVGARRPLAEDLRVREEDEAEVAQDEPAPRRRTAKNSPARPASSSPGSRTTGSIRRRSAFVRRASPRWAKVTTTRLPPRTNASRSRSASESPRAATAGRCASNAYGWPAGSWLSSIAPARPS